MSEEHRGGLPARFRSEAAIDAVRGKLLDSGNVNACPSAWNTRLTAMAIIAALDSLGKGRRGVDG